MFFWSKVSFWYRREWRKVWVLADRVWNWCEAVFFQRSGLGATTSRNDRSRTRGSWKSCQDQLGGEIWEIEEVAGLGLSSHFFLLSGSMGNQRVILRWCPSADLVTFLGVRRQCVPRIFKFPIAGSHIKRSKASDLLVTLQRFPAAQNTPNQSKSMCVSYQVHLPFFWWIFFFGSRHCRSPAPSEMETASSPSLGDLGPLAPTAVFVQQRLSKMVHLVALGDCDTWAISCFLEWYPCGTCAGCPDTEKQSEFVAASSWFGSVLVNYSSFIFSFTKSAGSKC